MGLEVANRKLKSEIAQLDADKIHLGQRNIISSFFLGLGWLFAGYLWFWPQKSEPVQAPTILDAPSVPEPVQESWMESNSGWLIPSVTATVGTTLGVIGMKCLASSKDESTKKIEE